MHKVKEMECSGVNYEKPICSPEIICEWKEERESNLILPFHRKLWKLIRENKKDLKLFNTITIDCTKADEKWFNQKICTK